VILGCVNVHPDEVNPGRVAALRLGCGDQVPGWTVQRNCASGMQSIDTGFRYIQAGQSDLILAGGAEALSHSPILFKDKMVHWLADWSRARAPLAKLQAIGRLRLSFFGPSIGLIRGLTDPVVKLSMGQTAEVLAHRFNISREQADEYAVESHHRLTRAHSQGWLAELEPAIGTNGKVYDFDDGVRPDNSMADVGKLKPVFERPFGKVTAGNSSQITDGASWTLLASERALKDHDLKPIARLVDSEWAALSPTVMGLGPVLSSTPILQRHRLKKNDIGTWEINEAFAAQVLACLKAWTETTFCKNILGLEKSFGAIDRKILNVDGGAISLGHPVGTSGNRIVIHLIHAMKRLKAKRGIATECIGGGMGGAMLIEAL
jgi:acetyl-CoA C-acetyltransferase